MIYLDNAATTELLPEVLEEMIPYYRKQYGNPSGIYQLAAEAAEAVDNSRKIISDFLHTEKDTIYFTAGGTEADNWALIGAAERYGREKKHLITTAFEHHAVLHTMKYLESRGYEVTYVKPEPNGIISTEKIEKEITDNTFMISVMFANNEIGTIQPIEKIGAIAKKHHILFHTDAVQAFGHIPIYPKELGIDLMSVSGHKIHGPKGTGFLYIDKEIEIGPLLHGGKQEGRKRAGTENVAGIVGMKKAVQLAYKNMSRRSAKELELRNYMIREILRKIPYVKINGDLNQRLPNNVNVSFYGIEGNALLIMLDMRGICVSAGSACTAGSTTISHVLEAIGADVELAHGTIRISLCWKNTKQEVDIFIHELCQCVSKLRKKS